MRVITFLKKLVGVNMIHIYLETEPKSGIFHYRGEAGPNDDPQGYKILMEKEGLRVILEPERGQRTITSAPEED